MPDVLTETLPVDSDIDLHVPARRREFPRAPASVLAAVSIGGAIGALARWGISAAFPTPADGFPWATFTINITGCALIGMLMVLVGEVFTSHRLIRPFVGVGILGGYTTFSTYAVDIQRLISAGSGGIALAYLAATAVAAVCATIGGMGAARSVAGAAVSGRRMSGSTAGRARSGLAGGERSRRGAAR